MLLLDDDLGYAARPVVRECFGRMLEQAVPLRRLAGRHRRRQVNQPLRICREAAHHLEGSGGVLLSNCDVPVQPGRDEPFASDIVNVEEIIVGLLRAQSRCCGGRQERPNRIGVGLEGGHRHQFLLRPTQGGQPAAEHATGINVDRAVEPLRLRNGRVSVDDARTAAVLGRPVVANGQAELVRLSGCLAKQGEIPHFGRPATLHFLLHAGVRHDETPIVEHVVADEAIEEFLHLCAELRRLQIQLRQAFDRGRG